MQKYESQKILQSEKNKDDRNLFDHWFTRDLIEVFSNFIDPFLKESMFHDNFFNPFE